jgi:DNA polymerase I
MIDGLKSRYKVEECIFNTILGTFQGHRIFASRKVAEKIDIQTCYAAELYNVDVRQDQSYLAEKGLFPCGDRDESRFSPDFEVPLSSLEIQFQGDPSLPREISRY